MTYCVGLLTRAGMVMIADTRTNAGIDNISIYRKLHILQDNEDRLMAIASAGSLSVTQSMLSMLTEGLPPLEEGGIPRTLAGVPTMFRAAQLVGEAVRAASYSVGATLSGTGINAGISLLLGGRIQGGPLHLFMIYGEGNFIECSPDSPFLQIGELKYGKPILDRALAYDTELDEAVKVGLISFDSTLRSNLSVGRPFDLLVVPSDATKPDIRLRISEDDAYFDMLSSEWGRLLNESRAAIPVPPFMKEV
ncbi:putative proteasome-type protease [Sphingomonas zeicaulis]|uniref:peptidase n=1 Tax=Sphingomonas zeicaulis TaxID=1632740 RepID=UPI003D2030A7